VLHKAAIITSRSHISALLYRLQRQNSNDGTRHRLAVNSPMDPYSPRWRDLVHKVAYR
jgi:hypothetical protein